MSKFVQDNKDMEPLALLWHQRVGIAAIVDKIWSATKTDERVPGILIADEVGIGKTALTMGFIAFIIDAFWVQEVKAGRGRLEGVTSNINLENLHPVPILGECCVLGRSPEGAMYDLPAVGGGVAAVAGVAVCQDRCSRGTESEGLGLSSCAVPLTRVRALNFRMKSGWNPTKSEGLPEAGYSCRVLKDFRMSTGNFQRTIRKF
ncbi:hypothetical protein BDR03DRAFT_1013621 [Suillus americanus]|nr:hypothetical protein BDR03DRAFT_1013621 [Suillus americanus]